MLYPNPFDFDRSGDLGFPERAYMNEFLSGEDEDHDVEYDSDEWGSDDK